MCLCIFRPDCMRCALRGFPAWGMDRPPRKRGGRSRLRYSSRRTSAGGTSDACRAGYHTANTETIARNTDVAAKLIASCSAPIPHAARLAIGIPIASTRSVFDRFRHTAVPITPCSATAGFRRRSYASPFVWTNPSPHAGRSRCGGPVPGTKSCPAVRGIR